MTRQFLWIETPLFAGWVCSGCGWFYPLAPEAHPELSEIAFHAHPRECGSSPDQARRIIARLTKDDNGQAA